MYSCSKRCVRCRHFPQLPSLENYKVPCLSWRDVNRIIRLLSHILFVLYLFVGKLLIFVCHLPSFSCFSSFLFYVLFQFCFHNLFSCFNLHKLLNFLKCQKCWGLNLIHVTTLSLTQSFVSAFPTSLFAANAAQVHCLFD